MMHAKIVRWKQLETPDHPNAADEFGVLVSLQGSAALTVPLRSANSEPLHQAFFTSSAKGGEFEFHKRAVQLAVRLGVRLPRSYEEVRMIQVDPALAALVIRNASLAESVLAISEDVQHVFDLADVTGALAVN